MPRGNNTGKKYKPRATSYKTAMTKMENGLTVDQEAYCRARATGMSRKEAAIATGIMCHMNTLGAWERLPTVMARISELSAMATDNAILKTGLNREWVIKRLMEVVTRCMTTEPVLDKKGEPTGEYTFDSSGANTALRMLGDTMGLFKPAEKKPEDEYANLSDDDLARIAGEIASQVGLNVGAQRIEATAGSQQVIDVQAVSKAN